MSAMIIKSREANDLKLTAYHGHFATRHSHNSHYLDITRMKHECAMANIAAASLANHYVYEKEIDRGEFFLLTMPCFGDCSPLFTRSIKAQDKRPQSLMRAARPQSPTVRGFSENRQPPSVWRFYKTIAVGHSAKSRVCRALRRF